MTDKELICAKDPGGCKPWFTQYVNYAANKGMIKGYKNSDGTFYFNPDASILRIHALKLIMADNGNVSLESDVRYQRLADDPRIQGRVPRCLAGAEDSILENNGGADEKDAQKLLAYALLADKLDLFGNRCQIFEENNKKTPQKRAEFLQEPITRQEIARYFALTTTYNPIKADLNNDTTTDTKEEYIFPVITKKEQEANALAKLDAETKESVKDTADKTKQTDDEPEEITYVDPPVPPRVSIEGCDSFVTGRANTKDSVKDCIRNLKKAGKSDEEIDKLLKEKGVWSYVKDERDEKAVADSEKEVSDSAFSIISALQTEAEKVENMLESEQVKMLRMVQNLELYLSQGHSLEETLSWGLKGKKEGTLEYIYVMSWYELRGGQSVEKESDKKILEEIGLFLKEAGNKANKAANLVVDEGVKLSKEAWFVVTEPKATKKIGLFDFELNNISSIAGRFAFNGGFSKKPNRHGMGSQRNAFRHVLWQAMITNQISFDVALKAGNAHEVNHKEGLVLKEYSKLEDADESTDLRNNMIGRLIGVKNPGKTPKELALITVKYFYNEGLWLAIYNEKKDVYIVEQRKLSDGDYKTYKQFTSVLDENGS